MNQDSINTIDEYIAGYSPSTQKLLKEMRKTIHGVVPQASEDIRYGMPTFRLHDRNLVHFAAFEHHIGFYPAPSGIVAFAKELKQYKTSKGAVQFPIDQPLPLDLIVKIVKFRVTEEENR